MSKEIPQSATSKPASKATKRKPSAVAKREMAKIRRALGLPRYPEPI